MAPVAGDARFRGPPGLSWDHLASQERRRTISPQRVREPALAPGSIRRVPRGPPRGPCSNRGGRGGRTSQFLLQGSAFKQPGSSVGCPHGASASGMCVGHPRGVSSWGVRVGHRPRMKGLLQRAFVIIQDVASSHLHFFDSEKLDNWAKFCKCGFDVFRFHGKTTFFDLLADSPEPRTGSPASSLGESVCGG